ncbi:hypothetical protein ACROYT_G010712 [Oculina patagonica]
MSCPVAEPIRRRDTWEGEVANSCGFESVLHLSREFYSEMATYQIKVEYGDDKRFSTFLLYDITLEKLLSEVKRHCSPLAHLPTSNIKIRFRDEDGDFINLFGSDGFAFQEMLRSSKTVKDQDYRKIYLVANEVDSPMPKKECGVKISFKQSPLDAQQQEIEDNLQMLRVQITSAKDELAKLSERQKEFRSLGEIRGRVCNNCHQGGHTKTTCSGLSCNDINWCKIKDKHPEEKQKVTALQREIKTLETKFIEEESNFKKFTAARERRKFSFFAVMRPRLKAQNMFKYSTGNRNIVDRDLLILQRALKKVPDWDESEDWRLLKIIEQYEKSNVDLV